MQFCTNCKKDSGLTAKSLYLLPQKTRCFHSLLGATRNFYAESNGNNKKYKFLNFGLGKSTIWLLPTISDIKYEHYEASTYISFKIKQDTLVNIPVNFFGKRNCLTIKNFNLNLKKDVKPHFKNCLELNRISILKPNVCSI